VDGFNIGEGLAVTLGDKRFAALVSPSSPVANPRETSNPSVHELPKQTVAQQDYSISKSADEDFTWSLMTSQGLKSNTPFIEYIGLACHTALPPIAEECLSQINVPQPTKPNSDH
jgi:hypothetical protein